MRRLAIVITGVVVGLASYYFLLSLAWFNVMPWAIVTLIIGYLSNGRKDIILNGGLFGYTLFVVYILIGYEGKMDAESIRKILSFSLLFSLVGAAAGIIGAFIGNFIKKKLNKP